VEFSIALGFLPLWSSSSWSASRGYFTGTLRKSATNRVTFADTKKANSPRTILWEHVDLDAHEIRLPGSITKNGESRILPLVGALVHRLKVESKDSGRVFPIGVFHKSWWSACIKAGLGTRTQGKKNGGWGTYEGLIPHDLRRSALRNMRRRGISTTVAKKISGHLTDAVFERYNITSTEDLHDAANRIEAGSRVLELQPVGSSSGQVTLAKKG